MKVKSFESNEKIMMDNFRVALLFRLFFAAFFRLFAWRYFIFSRGVISSFCVAYFRMALFRHFAWRYFAWRPFVFSHGVIS